MVFYTKFIYKIFTLGIDSTRRAKMTKFLGIRREDKNKWEARVPIIPQHVTELKNNFNIQTIIQPSKIRVFKDKEFSKAGATVSNDFKKCQTIFAIKEIPIDFFESKKTYIFFSHTIKGQKFNMPMLQKMIDLKCNLIDYEKITDEKGRRLVFFGRYAGLAGMVDTLWSYGRRMESKKINTPLNEIKHTIDYHDLQEIKNHFQDIGEKIKNNGIPSEISPLVIGITGYGNVSKGAQEILDVLPIENISPKELEKIFNNPSKKIIYKVVFKEEDMVEPRSKADNFNLRDYYKHPEKYTSIFHRYVTYLSMLVNCIFWDYRYPRLITKDYAKKNFSNDFKLQVIGDISIDINGAIEFTEKSTTPDCPSFVYNPKTGSVIDGFKGEGIVVMGVDNLPCELPKESSNSFSNTLIKFIPDILNANFDGDFSNCKLPQSIKKAVILYHGNLTSDYKYLEKYL
jgi:alpha-aminoadipic semialdehyde synthase